MCCCTKNAFSDLWDSSWDHLGLILGSSRCHFKSCPNMGFVKVPLGQNDPPDLKIHVQTHLYLHVKCFLKFLHIYIYILDMKTILKILSFNFINFCDFFEKIFLVIVGRFSIIFSMFDLCILKVRIQKIHFPSTNTSGSPFSGPKLQFLLIIFPNVLAI